MLKTLKKVASRDHVAHVDDERFLGNSIIITLKQPWCFEADKGCGVMGFDTVAEAEIGTRASAVYNSLACAIIASTTT